jgi:SnoaL-like protein
MQDLIDRQAIADVVSRLGLWLDGDTTLDQARAILAEDVSISTPGGVVQGIEPAVEQAARNHTEKTQHVITNLLVDLDGDTAKVGANSIITFPDRTLTGRYAFETRRTPEGWRLTRIASA